MFATPETQYLAPMPSHGGSIGFMASYPPPYPSSQFVSCASASGFPHFPYPPHLQPHFHPHQQHLYHATGLFSPSPSLPPLPLPPCPPPGPPPATASAVGSCSNVVSSNTSCSFSTDIDPSASSAGSVTAPFASKSSSSSSSNINGTLTGHRHATLPLPPPAPRFGPSQGYASNSQNVPSAAYSSTSPPPPPFCVLSASPVLPPIPLTSSFPPARVSLHQDSRCIPSPSSPSAAASEGSSRFSSPERSFSTTLSGSSSSGICAAASSSSPFSTPPHLYSPHRNAAASASSSPPASAAASDPGTRSPSSSPAPCPSFVPAPLSCPSTPALPPVPPAPLAPPPRLPEFLPDLQDHHYYSMPHHVPERQVVVLTSRIKERVPALAKLRWLDQQLSLRQCPYPIEHIEFTHAGDAVVQFVSEGAMAKALARPPLVWGNQQEIGTRACTKEDIAALFWVGVLGVPSDLLPCVRLALQPYGEVRGEYAPHPSTVDPSASLLHSDLNGHAPEFVPHFHAPPGAAGAGAGAAGTGLCQAPCRALSGSPPLPSLGMASLGARGSTGSGLSCSSCSSGSSKCRCSSTLGGVGSEGGSGVAGPGMLKLYFAAIGRRRLPGTIQIHLPDRPKGCAPLVARLFTPHGPLKPKCGDFEAGHSKFGCPECVRRASHSRSKLLVLCVQS